LRQQVNSGKVGGSSAAASLNVESPTLISDRSR